jgi:hypothetical protein
MAFSLPDNSPIDDAGNKVDSSWLQWLSQVNSVVNAVTQSGTTAHRPTRLVWIGRQYFDTDLGIPIYVASVGPVVWVDAAGSTV